eukprot:TRINITY_DN62585_c0_g1_i1.p1 TRINITY_DN62585_c0_g1~~TRINITY_DN62585_c0_g1_i1.p1  ORF type:complete len:320 (+),score=29.37 TRINITY_DN62585_c0_g1_i1:97-1056(+)
MSSDYSSPRSARLWQNSQSSWASVVQTRAPFEGKGSTDVRRDGLVDRLRDEPAVIRSFASQTVAVGSSRNNADSTLLTRDIMQANGGRVYGRHDVDAKLRRSVERRAQSSQQHSKHGRRGARDTRLESGSHGLCDGVSVHGTPRSPEGAWVQPKAPSTPSVQKSPNLQTPRRRGASSVASSPAASRAPPVAATVPPPEDVRTPSMGARPVLTSDDDAVGAGSATGRTTSRRIPDVVLRETPRRMWRYDLHEALFVDSVLNRSSFDVLNNVKPHGRAMTPRGKNSRSLGLELDKCPGLRESRPHAEAWYPTVSGVPNDNF